MIDIHYTGMNTVQSVKFLGLILDRNLIWDRHIDSLSTTL